MLVSVLVIGDQPQPVGPTFVSFRFELDPNPNSYLLLLPKLSLSLSHRDHLCFSHFRFDFQLGMLFLLYTLIHSISTPQFLFPQKEKAFKASLFALIL